jgi:DNA polymerase-3 subunit delta'
VAFLPNVALDYLRRAHEQERLAHAYLISGTAGSGKRQLANEVAHLVNRTARSSELANRENVYLVEPESKSRRIVVEQVRDLEHSLRLSVAPGQRKVAVIAEADRLQLQAANAFLKTLEEPPNHSLLLLLTALPELLPDTIISRCITVQLASPARAQPSEEEAEMIQLLGSFDGEKSGGVQAAFRLAHGLVRLLAVVRQNIQADHADALKADETRYKNTTDGSWLEQREDHYKALTESRYLEKRSRLIEIIFLWWTDVLRAKSNLADRELPAARAQTEAIAAKLTATDILQRLRRLEDLRDYLSRNIQEALALEVVFLKIFSF